MKMTDKNSSKKNEQNRPGAPRDLPSKPNDKKTDDKVKGGMRPHKTSDF
jgi:hypothetical protein